MKRWLILLVLVWPLYSAGASDVAGHYERAVRQRIHFGSFSPYNHLVANSEKPTRPTIALGVGNMFHYDFDKSGLLNSYERKNSALNKTANVYVEFSHLISDTFLYSLVYAPNLSVRAELTSYYTFMTPAWATVVPYGFAFATTLSVSYASHAETYVARGQAEQDIKSTINTPAVALSPQVDLGSLILGGYAGVRLYYLYDYLEYSQNSVTTRTEGGSIGAAPYLGFNIYLLINTNWEVGYDTSSAEVFANFSLKYYFRQAAKEAQPFRTPK